MALIQQRNILTNTVMKSS